MYCCDPREVRGEKPTMKKWRRGNGIRFTASFRRSELSWPGNLRQQVTPLIVAEIKWFRSPTAAKNSYNEIQGEALDCTETAFCIACIETEFLRRNQ